jgi:hypothetical protein
MPCTGCFGPLGRVTDYGAKAASFIASIIDFQDEESIENVVDKLADPVGNPIRSDEMIGLVSGNMPKARLDSSYEMVLMESARKRSQTRNSQSTTTGKTAPAVAMLG